MTTNNDQASEEKLNENQEAEIRQLIESVFKHTEQTLKVQFEECEAAGQVANYPGYGPVFIYQLRSPEDRVYACGFLLNELINVFRNNANPGTWLSSFFVALMEKDGSQPLPASPNSEEEAKALYDKTIIPLCIESVHEEFQPEQVYAGLNIHKEHGTVLEAGFPSISEGNNVCAIPLPFLLMQYLLNRDPSEAIVQNLYRIRQEHGLE